MEQSEGVARVEPATALDGAALDVHRWLLPVIALGTILAPLNSTMIAVAFPKSRRAFGASVTAAAWLITFYLAAMTVAQPIGGWLGDALGRRQVYLIGLAWFGLAGIACALSPNLLTLILFRAQQALAGAMIFPNGTAIVREVTGGHHRSSGFGIITFARGLGAAAGPPLGGLLVHGTGWSSIFWVNVPVVALALLLGWPSLPRRAVARDARRRFDWAGSLLLALSLGTLIAIPTIYEQASLALAALAGGAGVLLGAVFAWRELRTPSPVVHLQLFRHRPFAAACIAVGLSNLILFTTWLAVPLFIQEVLGRSAPVAGVTLAVMSVFFAFSGEAGGRLADRFGRRVPLLGGALCLAVGVVLQAGALALTGLLVMAGTLALMGIGLGLPDAPLQEAAFGPIPAEHSGSADGVYTTIRYLGIVIGSTAFAFIFVHPPHAGEHGPFIWLFAGLIVIALAGIAATARVATWNPAGNRAA